MTDPSDPTKVTPLKPDPEDPNQGDINDYYDRMEKLAGKPIVFRIVRQDDAAAAHPVEITVQPEFRSDLGLRMRMGEVAALRVGGPAEKAGVKARTESPAAAGDEISVVKLPEADGKETWFASGDIKADNPKVTVRKLDPVLLPLEVKRWAERNPGQRKVKLVVLRTVELKEKNPVELELTYDDSYGHEREVVSLPNTPEPLTGLGLAYWVQPVVDSVEPNSPAAQAGLKAGDLVTAARLVAKDYDGTDKPGEWEEIKANQWAAVDAAFQGGPPIRSNSG